MKFAACVLALCVVATAVSAAPKVHPTGHRSKLDAIFQHDMLGAQVPYLERITGPAWRVIGNDRFYKVAGCTVTVATADHSIRSWALDLNDRCTFDPNPFFVFDSRISGRLPSANRITFGEFDRLFRSGQFSSDCITMCGNAADPTAYELVRGGSVANDIDAKLEVVLVGDDALAASRTWAQSMARLHGEDYVNMGQFQCDRDSQPVARAAFAAVRITTLTVGYDIVFPRCRR